MCRMRDNAPVERIFFSFSFVRSYWNCVKGTNDVLSGMEVSRWLFGRPVFFCAVVSRNTDLPFDPSCRNQDPHMRSHVVV